MCQCFGLSISFFTLWQINELVRSISLMPHIDSRVIYDLRMDTLKSFFSRKPKQVSTQVESSAVIDMPKTKGGIPVLDAATLVANSTNLRYQISKTRQSVSVTKEVWDKQYLQCIHNFIDIVQGLPASASYHHAYRYGLVEHSLEVMANACRISAGYILPPNIEVEYVSRNVERWRMAILLAALMHDAGKLLGDIDVVVNEKGKWRPFLPAYEQWPKKADYKYRYRPKKTGHSKSLHERGALLIFNRVVTRDVFGWLNEDPILMQMMLDTLTYTESLNNVIKEIVIRADSASVAKAVGHNPEKASNITVSIADKALAIIKELLHTKEISYNCPGAVAWISKDYTFFVSKRLVDTVSQKMRQMKIQGVPQDTDKILLAMANAHCLLKSPINGKDLYWMTQVNDYGRDWKAMLTMIVIPNNLLDIDSSKLLFDGEIELMDRQKKPVGMVFYPDKVEITNNELSLGAADDMQTVMLKPDNADDDNQNTQQPSQQVTQNPQPETPIAEAPPRAEINEQAKEEEQSQEISPQQQNQESQSSQQSIIFKDIEPEDKQDKRVDNANDWQVRAEQSAVNKTNCESPAPVDDYPLDKIGLRGITKEELAKLSKLDRDAQQALLLQNPFLSYVFSRVKDLKIRCNEPNAPVHITKSHIVLVSPKIFNQFLNDKKNAMKKKRYEVINQTVHSALQREIESLGINYRVTGGKNIIKVLATGREKSVEFSAYLIERQYFPMFDSFSPNPSLKLQGIDFV